MPVKDAARTFRALSDPTRLRIMLLVMRRDLCVCELTFILKMEQSRVSHQLRILRDAGLVEDIRTGRWIIYRVPAAARKVLHTLLETLLAPELKASSRTAGDVKRLDICLKQEVRQRHGRAS
jgi:ArsR family transcriptional regulator